MNLMIIIHGSICVKLLDKLEMCSVMMRCRVNERPTVILFQGLVHLAEHFARLDDVQVDNAATLASDTILTASILGLDLGEEHQCSVPVKGNDVASRAKSVPLPDGKELFSLQMFKACE